MAKRPIKVDDNEMLARTVVIPGWAYNFMIDQAARQRRDVKAEISIMLEKAIRAAMKEAGVEPGNFAPELLKAA